MSETSDERIVLAGEKALELWRQGKDAWNKWVEEHPEADVYFFGTDFSKERNVKDVNVISFRDFLFPSGEISFCGATFGAGDVDFSEAEFGAGDIDFSHTIFGEGYVDFSDASIGEGDVDFSYTKFGEGRVDFSHTKFGEGYVDFSETEFGAGDIDFSHTRFGEGYVDFSYASIGEGDVDFSHTVFKSNVLFETLNHVSRVYSFSFRHTVFDGPLEISTNHGEAFSCVPDFTGTKTTHHVSLEGLKCNFPRQYSKFIRNAPSKFWTFKGNWLGQKIAIDPEDGERLRRLKELAENNKDHQKALDFHIMEMKAMRKFKPSKWWPLPLLINSEFWFDKLSDYGRSIERPFTVLLFVWVIFAWIYALCSAFFTQSFNYISSLVFSGTQILPFVPIGRSARSQTAEMLFNSPDIPLFIYFFAFGQSIISLVLIFLIGLALKHRFKL